MKNIKNILITGASGGIGSAISKQLITNYPAANVFSIYNHHQPLYGIPYKADLTSPSEISTLFSTITNKYGTIDILINCAGISLTKQVQDTTLDEWDSIFNTNARATFLCCKHALPSMISAKRGVIVNVSSIWGVSGASCEAIYSASKGAVEIFTKSLAKEVAPSNIRVNSVAPGAIDTNMLDSLNNEDKNIVRNQTPLGRLGTPEDIAQAVAFLASDSASFITGHTLIVDGGLTL
ncbi:MAG: SDR family oxidoreductase [Clostridiales bacterium]|nr:SDR family oxidoreductase [Clostridiales bacterium]